MPDLIIEPVKYNKSYLQNVKKITPIFETTLLEKKVTKLYWPLQIYLVGANALSSELQN